MKLFRVYSVGFSFKVKTTGQTPNNFTILNRSYNIERYNLRKKKKTLFFFSLTALFLTVYLSQFSLIFFLLLLIQFFKIASVVTLWNFTFFLHHFKWPNGLSFYFFIFSFFSPFHTLHIKSQKMQANLSWLCFNQFLFFWYPLAKWPLPFASFFSFFFQRVQHA